MLFKNVHQVDIGLVIFDRKMGGTNQANIDCIDAKNERKKPSRKGEFTLDVYSKYYCSFFCERTAFSYLHSVLFLSWHSITIH